MATIVAKAGAAGNWTAGTSWVGGIAPTAADDAQIGAGTTSITIDSGAVCRSADFTGYTGTTTHTAGVTFTIGDATAGLGNVALILAGTYNLGNATTSAISFVSTSATQQTVDFGGKTAGNITFGGTGSDYAITTALNSGASATVSCNLGTVHFDGAADNLGLSHNIGRLSIGSGSTHTVTMGTCTVTLTGASATVFNINSSTGLTFNKGTFILIMSGTASLANFNGSGTMPDVRFTGSGACGFVTTAGTTFTNLTRTGTAAKTDSFLIIGNYTVTTALNINGNSVTNRMLVNSNTLGTQRTFTTTGCTVTVTNTDFRDINMSVAIDLSAITGLSGDCGGNNANITLTSPTTQTWNGSTGSASTAASWTSRTPLPQDTVAVTSGTVTFDMPRSGKDITFSGTGNGTFNTGTEVYGSLTLRSGMTYTQTATITLSSRASATLTCAGNTFTNITQNSFGGSYTLQDALTLSGTYTLTGGTLLNTSNFSVSLGLFVSTGSLTRALTIGSATWTITSAGPTTPWSVTATLSLTSTGSTIFLSSASASSKTFAGAGLVYNDLKIAGGGAGAIIITGANTFNRIYTDGLGTKSITLPGSTTTTIVSGLGLANGTNIITFTASAGSATVSKSGGGTVGWDYVSLTNIPAVQTSTWYAGTHSTDGLGNTNWIFTDPPSSGLISRLMLLGVG